MEPPNITPSPEAASLSPLSFTRVTEELPLDSVCCDLKKQLGFCPPLKAHKQKGENLLLVSSKQVAWVQKAACL